jgi:hypothetical protein
VRSIQDAISDLAAQAKAIEPLVELPPPVPSIA